MFFFFFTDARPTEIYTLSLHDALPIWLQALRTLRTLPRPSRRLPCVAGADRKSTRLNSSHANISYAVFCLKKKNTTHTHGHNHHHLAPSRYASDCLDQYI